MTRRLLAVLAYLVIATLVLGFLGVGGYRAGFVWVAIALPAAGAGLAWILLRDADTNRPVWCLAVAAISIVAAAKLVDYSPDSTARLDHRLDALTLPFFTRTAEHRSGHGWCSPHCPEVERVYKVPATAPRAAYFTVLLALQQQHLLAAGKAPPDVTVAGQPVRVRAHRVTVTVTASPPRVTIDIRARRG